MLFWVGSGFDGATAAGFVLGCWSDVHARALVLAKGFLPSESGFLAVQSKQPVNMNSIYSFTGRRYFG